MATRLETRNIPLTSVEQETGENYRAYVAPGSGLLAYLRGQHMTPATLAEFMNNNPWLVRRWTNNAFPDASLAGEDASPLTGANAVQANDITINDDGTFSLRGAKYGREALTCAVQVVPEGCERVNVVRFDIRRNDIVRIPDSLTQVPVTVRCDETGRVISMGEFIPEAITRAETSTSNITLRARVADVEYPGGGALGTAPDGTQRYSHVRDVVNMFELIEGPGRQPVPAARGRQARGTGAQTVEGTLLRGAYEVAVNTPIPFTIGSVTFVAGLFDDTWGPQSADRIMWGRQGSGTTDMQIAGRAQGEMGGIDILGASTWTRFNGTKLPGTFRIDATRRTIENPGPHDHNDIYFGAVPNLGADAPAITMSAHELRTGEPNRFLSGRPSDAVPLFGLSNYGLAAYAYNHTQRETSALSVQIFGDGRTPGARVTDVNAYQRYVDVLRYQQDLVGMSNYDITSAALIERLATKHPSLLTAEERTQLQSLNPREILEYQIQLAEHYARTNSVSGVDFDPEHDNYMERLRGENYPVRSMTRAELRTEYIAYYTEMANTQEDAFKDFVQRETGVRPDYQPDGQRGGRDGRLEAVVAAFVDNHTVAGTNATPQFPEHGINFQDTLNPLVHHPDSVFSPHERFERITTRPMAESRSAAVSAMSVLAEDDEITRMLLVGAGQNDVMATAWANFDDSTVQRPRQYRGSTWNRESQLTALRSRGYSEGLIGVTFSDEETHGIIRDFDTVQRDLGASANRPEVVDLRQEDLRLMMTAGVPSGNEGVLRGQHALDMMNAIAQTPGLHDRIEERIITRYATAGQGPAAVDALRALNARQAPWSEYRTALSAFFAPTQLDAALGQMQSLRDGVNYARNHHSLHNIGVGTVALAHRIVAAEEVRDNTVPGTGSVRERVDTVTSTQLAVNAGNATTIFTHLGSVAGQSGAQVLIAGITDKPELAGALLLNAAEKLTPAEQLQLVNAIGVNRLRALSDSVPEASNQRNAYTQSLTGPTVANANEILRGAAAASADSDFAATWAAVGANPLASRLVVGGLRDNTALVARIMPELSTEERANIITRGGVRLQEAPDATPAQIWARVAADQAVTVNTTVTENVTYNAPGLERFVQARGIVDNNSQMAAYGAAYLGTPTLRRYALESIVNPRGIPTEQATIIQGMNLGIAINHLTTAPSDVQRTAIIEQLRDQGVDGARRLGQLLQRVADGRNGSQEQLMQHLNEHPELRQALITATFNAPPYQDRRDVRGSRPGIRVTGGSEVFAASWTTIFNTLQANPNAQLNSTVAPEVNSIIRDAVLHGTLNSIVNRDPTAAAFLSASTREHLAESFTVPSGFFLPGYIIPTGWTETRTSTENVTITSYEPPVKGPTPRPPIITTRTIPVTTETLVGRGVTDLRGAAAIGVAIQGVEHVNGAAPPQDLSRVPDATVAGVPIRVGPL